MAPVLLGKYEFTSAKSQETSVNPKCMNLALHQVSGV